MSDRPPVQTVIRERVTCPVCRSALVHPNRGAPPEGGKAYYVCRVEVCAHPFAVVVVRSRDAVGVFHEMEKPSQGDGAEAD